MRDMAHTFTASGSTPAVNLLEKFLEAFLRISSAPWEFTLCGQKTQISLFPCGFGVPSSGFSS